MRPRWLVGSLAAALLALVAAAAVPSLALAHANLERADPAPGSDLDQAPHQLQLYFSEPVDPSFSQVHVLNEQRDAVDRGDSHVAPDDPRSLIVSLPNGLPNGVYTVSWRTVSAVDGHTVDGAYPLIIGPMPAAGVPAASAAASSQATLSPATAVGRWWFSVAASLLFGLLLGWRLVFRPVFGKSTPAALPRVAARARRLAIIAGVVLVLGIIYGALAQAATAADVPIWAVFGRPLADLLGRGRYATLWWPRLGLSVLALGLVAWGGVRGWVGRLALVATGLSLLTSSFDSHAAALLSGAYLAIIADWLHFLSVGAWFGGLVGVVFLLPSVVQASPSSGERLRAVVVQRFSTLALVAVGLIVVTGTFQAWLEVGSWDGLVQTAYGLSVTAKIVLLVLTLAFAVFNLLVARPSLARTAGRQSAAAATLARRLALSVRAEIVLLLAILVAAAVLTGLEPARQELAQRSGQDLSGGPVNRQLDISGTTVQVQITPAALGINQFSVILPASVDPNQVERVQLTLTYLDAELGSQPLVLSAANGSPNTWQATSPLLSQAGTWQAELLVRQTGKDDLRSAIRFLVAGPGGAAPPPSNALGDYPLLPSPLASVAYLLIAAGVVVVAVGLVRAARGGRRARRALQRQGALLAAGVLVVACGGYVYAQEQTNGVPLDVANVRDPIPPDQNSLAQGEQVYTTYCETCHGESGRGDGPTGLRLVPRPADLRVHTAPGVHTDGELFYWVSYGFPNSAMPAWKDTLTEEQRWDVINYIRATFGNPGSQPATGTAPAAPLAVPSPSVSR